MTGWPWGRSTAISSALLQVQEGGRLAVQEGRPRDALHSVKLEMEIREKLPKADNGKCASGGIRARLWDRLAEKMKAANLVQ